MSPAITGQQRAALYDQILDRLSGIGDIELAIEAEDFVTAERLGREYGDDLRLLLDDLGLGEDDREAVEIITPPDVLRRVLPRMRARAEALAASREAAWAEERELRDRSRLVAAACTSVLDELGDA